MVSTTGLAVTPTTQQINEQPLPIEAEIIEEDATDNETNESNQSDKTNNTNKPEPADEETSSEESYEIDDEEIDECNHNFSRSFATGGEEGDVWEYVCDNCGYTYLEPYEPEVTE